MPPGPGEVPADVWYSQATTDIREMASDRKPIWLEILSHAAGATASQPTQRWRKTMAELIGRLPAGDFDERFLAWTHLIFEPRTGMVLKPEQSQLLHTEHDVELRGLIWATIGTRDKRVVDAVSRLSELAFQKVRDHGPVSIKIGNACLFALSHASAESAVEELGVLESRLKSRTAKKSIKKNLKAVASERNLDREDLVETSVPTLGLTEVGHLEEPLGDFTAELTITDGGKSPIVWRRADGKVQKSVPAPIRSSHPAELKDLKATAKKIEKVLTAQRQRLDELFLKERSWPTSIWRERYLDHPIVGCLARRLIWSFKNTGIQASGVWLGDTVVNVDDEPIDWLEAEGTTVELWHPIGRPMDDVLAWRHWLERHELRQPFKQAHREVYVLTDAERRTRTYSNRYASHILRQHQFHALCESQGWDSQLRLVVDGNYRPPQKVLEDWGLRVEFWVDAVRDDVPAGPGRPAAFTYLSTDQVRFYRTGAAPNLAHALGGAYVTAGLEIPVNEPLPLELIPPTVFSEVMRDIDLFVGVASVGNDPTWSDGGPGGRYLEYWRKISFGHLTPSAQTRKQVLERLVPKLKIGPRCSFSEKFLVVRGELRTYKIHLGSGNILMEPNDQYLCIVPDSSAVSKGDSVFLPFEGDRTLSIILSKAMLLADDRKIKDPTIVRQIEST